MRKLRSLDLDEIDRQIVDLLEHNATVPAAFIGACVNLSASAVQRRVRRLRTAGVIRRIVADIDPFAVGRGYAALVKILLANARPDARNAFESWLRERPEVGDAWHVTGDVDYVMLVEVSDAQAYSSFVDQLMIAHPAIGKCQTLAALKRVKP